MCVKTMKPMVIVGAGQAASQCVLSLRTGGWAGDIIVIGDEAHVPYHRPPLSKAYLSGELPADKLPIRPLEYYQKQAVQMRLSTSIVSIDRAEKQVITAEGERIDYHKLCLATGVRSRKLSLEGMKEGADKNISGIHYLRSLEDINHISAHLQQSAGSVVIIGGGYIGLETAASLIKKDYQVTVLEAGERVLQRVTSPIISDFFTTLHSSYGVNVQSGVSIKRVLSENAKVSGVELADGQVIMADTLLIGIGVEVNDELAVQAKLAVNHGIVVNEYCQTEDPDIFAVGDCTWHHNPIYQQWLRLESVQNANDQAKVAATNMLGNELLAYNSLPWFWSDQYDVKLQIAGLSTAYDDYQVEGEVAEKDFSVSYYRAGKLIAVDAINRPRAFMQAKKQIIAALTDV